MRTIIFGCLLLSVVATGCAEVPPAVPSESEAQAVVFNAAGAPTVEIDVPGLHCENCSATACTLLADVPGVVEVKADATTKKAIIAVDQSTFDTEAARSALEEQFGEATIVGDQASTDRGLPADNS